MKILGISSLDTDSTASLLDGGKVVSSIAEERLSRIKMHAGFPERSIAAIFKENGLSPGDIDAVAYPFFPWPKEAWKMIGCLARDFFFNLGKPTGLRSKFYHEAYYLKWTCEAIAAHKKYHEELLSNLKRLGLDKKLVRVEHHLAHAASSFYSSGFDKALILTLDAYGSGLAGSISVGTPEGIKRVHNIGYPHSMGLYYSQVTEALGFRPIRHEGKIVGLAAFGDKNVLFDRIYRRFDTSNSSFKYISALDMKFCRELAKRYRREDIAAAYQAVLERVTADVVAAHLKKHNMKKVCLAGGVTANVKLNQRIFEIDGVEEIFVYPNMGDGGTGTGAALWHYYNHNKKRPSQDPIENVYFGPGYTNDEIKRTLDREGAEYAFVDDIEAKIAGLLAANKVVARFNGRMEYGPRALGNRSILYPATDPHVNDWLNKRLERTEFMPFAPATLYEHREQCYKNIHGADHAAKFMTITFDCTEYMKKTSPAAVHIDGTARPQLVTQEINPSFYRIIKEYHRITGIPSVINTSYNMHEEPIVCTVEDAVRSFRMGRLEYLAVGNYLITGKEAG